MVEIFVTPCSATKSLAGGWLPARERYAPSSRVRRVIALAGDTPLHFLSARFGLIPADTRIPYYDQTLPRDFDALTLPVASAALALRARKVERVRFAFDADDRGSDTYLFVIASACAKAGVELEFVPCPS